jgi:hypothetical protein
LQSHLGRVRSQSDIDYSLAREIYSQLHPLGPKSSSLYVYKYTWGFY